jgi:hypothetical protein
MHRRDESNRDTIDTLDTLDRIMWGLGGAGLATILLAIGFAIGRYW